VRLSYHVPYAVSLDADAAAFTTTLAPQATAVPDRFSIGVVPPYGWTIEQASGDELSPVGSLQLSGDLETVREISLVLRSSP